MPRWIRCPLPFRKLFVRMLTSSLPSRVHRTTWMRVAVCRPSQKSYRNSNNNRTQTNPRQCQFHPLATLRMFTFIRVHHRIQRLQVNSVFNKYSKVFYPKKIGSGLELLRNISKNYDASWLLLTRYHLSGRHHILHDSCAAVDHHKFIIGYDKRAVEYDNDRILCTTGWTICRCSCFESWRGRIFNLVGAIELSTGPIQPTVDCRW